MSGNPDLAPDGQPWRMWPCGTKQEPAPRNDSVNGVTVEWAKNIREELAAQGKRKGWGEAAGDQKTWGEYWEETHGRNWEAKFDPEISRKKTRKFLQPAAE